MEFGPFKRLEGVTTLAQRLSLLTALFLAPIVVLLGALTTYAVQDIVFTEREVRGTRLL